MKAQRSGAESARRGKEETAQKPTQVNSTPQLDESVDMDVAGHSGLQPDQCAELLEVQAVKTTARLRDEIEKNFLQSRQTAFKFSLAGI